DYGALPTEDRPLCKAPRVVMLRWTRMLSRCFHPVGSAGVTHKRPQKSEPLLKKAESSITLVATVRSTSRRGFAARRARAYCAFQCQGTSGLDSSSFAAG